MKTGRGGWWALAGFGVLTLLGLYVGAYYCLVDAVPVARGFDIPADEVIAAYGHGPGRFHHIPESIFWPINQIDRKVRPATWEVPPPVPISN